MGACFLAVFDGALRKWVFPDSADLIYFLKDALLAGAYLRFYFSERKLERLPRFVGLFFWLSLIWVFLQAFNSKLGSVVLGALGFKMYFFYAPMLWMAPQVFESLNELIRFWKVFLRTLYVVAGFAVLQFFSPLDHWLNAGLPEGLATPTFYNETAYIRVSSVFSFLGGFYAYIAGMTPPILAILFEGFKTRRWWVPLGQLVLLLGISMMSGSRAVTFSMLIVCAVFFVVRYIGNPREAAGYFQKAFFPLILVILASLPMLAPAFDSFSDRTKNTDSMAERIQWTLLQPVGFLGLLGVDSYGAGATHQAVVALRPKLGNVGGERIPVNFEPEPGRVMLELGAVGFFLWYGLRVALIWATARLSFSLRTTFCRDLALAVALVQCYALTVGYLVYNQTFAFFFWLLTSVVLVLPKLERDAKFTDALSPG